MSKRMVAWMLVIALLQVPSVWADPLGEAPGPVEVGRTLVRANAAAGTEKFTMEGSLAVAAALAFVTPFDMSIVPVDPIDHPFHPGPCTPDIEDDGGPLVPIPDQVPLPPGPNDVPVPLYVDTGMGEAPDPILDSTVAAVAAVPPPAAPVVLVAVAVAAVPPTVPPGNNPPDINDLFEQAILQALGNPPTGTQIILIPLPLALPFPIFIPISFQKPPPLPPYDGPPPPDGPAAPPMPAPRPE